MSGVDDWDDVHVTTTGYHPSTGRYHTRHDDDRDGGIATTVVEAVAAVTGDAPDDVDPLYDAVDPDALDNLVESLPDDGRGEVTFTLNDCIVTVRTTGAIEIELKE